MLPRIPYPKRFNYRPSEVNLFSHPDYPLQAKSLFHQQDLLERSVGYALAFDVASAVRNNSGLNCRKEIMSSRMPVQVFAWRFVRKSPVIYSLPPAKETLLRDFAVASVMVDGETRI